MLHGRANISAVACVSLNAGSDGVTYCDGDEANDALVMTRSRLFEITMTFACPTASFRIAPMRVIGQVFLS
jgi:hypothetical protein